MNTDRLRELLKQLVSSQPLLEGFSQEEVEFAFSLVIQRHKSLLGWMSEWSPRPDEALTRIEERLAAMLPPAIAERIRQERKVPQHPLGLIWEESSQKKNSLCEDRKDEPITNNDKDLQKQ